MIPNLGFASLSRKVANLGTYEGCTWLLSGSVPLS